jgi:hypothetical protein
MVGRFLLGGFLVVYVWAFIVAGRLMKVFNKGGRGAVSAGTKMAKLFLLSGSVAVVLSFFTRMDRIVFLTPACVVWLFAAYFWWASERIKKLNP